MPFGDASHRITRCGVQNAPVTLRRKITGTIRRQGKTVLPQHFGTGEIVVSVFRCRQRMDGEYRFKKRVGDKAAGGFNVRDLPEVAGMAQPQPLFRAAVIILSLGHVVRKGAEVEAHLAEAVRERVDVFLVVKGLYRTVTVQGTVAVK